MTKEKVIDILKGIKDGTAWLMPNMPEDGEKAIDIAIKVVEHPEPHWIPVTESPKEEEKSYWVCLEGGGQCQCRWTNDVYGLGANEWSKWGWKKVDLPQYSKVVAYMPLPEPYKGVTE